ncbi:MAG: hypothetical protein ACKVX9_01885 [Blastocatellia bacterium]
MEKSLTFADNESFYNQLMDLESRNEPYLVDTGVREAAKLPLRLMHHVGISKDEVAHVQHKVVEEGAIMHDFIEPLLVRFNELIGKYKPARGYEFTVQAEDYDTIKIHGRPRTTGANT